MRIQPLLWREIEGRAVIIDAKSGNVHELNDVGTFLWKKADGQDELETIVESVTSRFMIDQTAAEKDVAEFYRSLRNLNLIEKTAPSHV